MPAFEANARQNLALQRGGKPDEIVGAALYLASSGARLQLAQRSGSMEERDKVFADPCHLVFVLENVL